MQIIGAELDVLELHALDDDHRVVFQRFGDGVLDRAIERAALLDGLHSRVAAEHDLDLLVHHGVDDLIDRRVQPAELGVEVGYLLRRRPQRHADLQISRLLIVGVGVHLVPGVGRGPDADLLDAVDDGDLEAQARLRGADHGAVAQ